MNNNVFANEHNLSPRLLDIISYFALIDSGMHGVYKCDEEGYFWLTNNVLGEELPHIFNNDLGILKSRQSIYATMEQLVKKDLIEIDIRFNRYGKKQRYIRLTELGRTIHYKWN